MAKKSSKKKHIMMSPEAVIKLVTKEVEVKDLYDHSEESMKNSGTNVNLARAFPSLIDGLKIVERRIMYTMFLGHYYKASHKAKLAKIVGDVMGDFHPHGDTAIASVIVRLANDWRVPYPLVDSEGNFGNIYGAGPSHMRYIHGSASKFAMDCYFSEWTDNIVDFRNNYSDTKKEAEYLPCKYPMLLINGAKGIGYSVATSFPCFNFEEVCRAAMELMKDENVNIELVPDSPRPSQIVFEKDKKGVSYLKRINKYGAGKFKLRAPVTITNDGKNDIINITSIPFKYNLNKVIESIKNLVKDKKIISIKTLDNRSADHEIDLDIIIKENYDVQDTLNKLYAFKVLEDDYTVDMKSVKDLKVTLLSPKDILLEWLHTRRYTKRRIYNYRLSKSMKRQHELSTLIDVIPNSSAEQIIGIMRDSEDEDEIISKFIKDFNLTDIQAKAVASLSLASFSKGKLRKYIEEHEKLVEEIQIIKDKLTSTKLIDDEIKKELEDGIEKWALPRNASLTEISPKNDVSDMMCHVVLTKNNMVKKFPANIKTVGNFRKGDIPIESFTISNNTNFNVFTDTGKMLKVVTDKLPISDYRNHGYHIGEYMKMEGNIVSTFTDYIFELYAEKEKNDLDDLFLVTVSSEGLIKRTMLEEIMNYNTSATIMKLNEADKLTGVGICNSDNFVFIYTKNGKYIKFPISEVTVTKRSTKGVKITDFDKGDSIVGLTVLDTPKPKIVVTANGYLKRVSDNNIAITKRCDKPANLIKLDDSDEIVSVLPYNETDSVLKVYSQSGEILININDIPEASRLSRGKKMLNSRDIIIHVSIKNEIE